MSSTWTLEQNVFVVGSALSSLEIHHLTAGRCLHAVWQTKTLILSIQCAARFWTPVLQSIVVKPWWSPKLESHIVFSQEREDNNVHLHNNARCITVRLTSCHVTKQGKIQRRKERIDDGGRKTKRYYQEIEEVKEVRNQKRDKQWREGYGKKE